MKVSTSKTKVMKVATVAIAMAAFSAMAADAATYTRNTAAADLNTAAAWSTGGPPGAADLAQWNSTSVGGGQSLGGSVSWGGIFVVGSVPTSGPSFTNALNGSARTITLGSLGINMNGTTITNRGLTFESNTGIVVSAAQTWNLGLGQSTAANITVGSSISGTGSIEVTRQSGAANLLSLNGTNTYSGGTTLQANSLVSIVSGSGYAASSGTLTRSPFGIGPLTINGGQITTNNNNIFNPVINIGGDFTFATTTRTEFSPGSANLGGATRTITLTRNVTATNIQIGGGNNAIQVTPGTATSGLTNTSISNGTLRFAAPSTATSADFYGVSFAAPTGSTGNQFVSNAGLTLGSQVVMAVTSAGVWTASVAPSLTIESGGFLTLGDNTNTRNLVISSLAGSGTVLNYDSTTDITGTLTIDGGTRTVSTDFSGVIRNVDTTTFATGASDNVISLVKSGSTTQILSGANTYTGTTTVNGTGALIVNGSLSAGGGAVTVNAGTLGGSGNGTSTGLINRSVTIGNGTLTSGLRDSFLAPGSNGVGTLAAAVVTFATDGTLAIDVSDTGAGAADGLIDQLLVSGDLNITSAAINFNTLSGSTLNDAAYVFATYGSLTGSQFATVSNLPAGYSLNYSYGPGSNQIALVQTAIPEPTAAAIAVFGIGLLTRRRGRTAA
jgi:autotransporter-associated beta strand protein